MRELERLKQCELNISKLIDRPCTHSANFSVQDRYVKFPVRQADGKYGCNWFTD